MPIPRVKLKGSDKFKVYDILKKHLKKRGEEFCEYKDDHSDESMRKIIVAISGLEHVTLRHIEGVRRNSFGKIREPRGLTVTPASLEGIRESQKADFEVLRSDNKALKFRVELLEKKLDEIACRLDSGTIQIKHPQGRPHSSPPSA